MCGGKAARKSKEITTVSDKSHLSVPRQTEIISVYHNGYVALELNTFSNLKPALQDFLNSVHAAGLLCSSYSYALFLFLIRFTFIYFLTGFNDGKALLS